jgi:hypothetical protein
MAWDIQIKHLRFNHPEKVIPKFERTQRNRKETAGERGIKTVAQLGVQQGNQLSPPGRSRFVFMAVFLEGMTVYRCCEIFLCSLAIVRLIKTSGQAESYVRATWRFSIAGLVTRPDLARLWEPTFWTRVGYMMKRLKKLLFLIFLNTANCCPRGIRMPLSEI